MSLETLFDFLEAGVSRFHSVAHALTLLDAAGFLPLEEHRPWGALVPGQGYYLTRNGSSLAAFRMPRTLEGFRLVASHGDSPTFQVKASFPPAVGVTRLEVEGYGGMILPSWLDRPLTVAGRAMVETVGGVEPRLVWLDRDLLIIPSLCPHFDREGAAGRKLNPQTDLQPLFGGKDAPALRAIIAGELGVAPEEILSLELTLTPRQKPVVLGAEGEFFASPRIDDLECASTSLEGFLTAAPAPGMANLWVMLDNEEVGSSTRQGACGTFVKDLLDRILLAAGVTGEGRYPILANSLALSADNGHAVHPGHPEKSDPLHSPVLGGGVLLKLNATRRYTTDGVMEALLTRLARQENIPLQTFYNRGDIAGGSTLGNLLQHSVSIPMADVGAPQLAMHAAVETAATADALALEALFRAFYAAPLPCRGDGRYGVL